MGIFRSAEVDYLGRIFFLSHLAEDTFPDPYNHSSSQDQRRAVILSLAGSAGYVFLAQTIAKARPGRRQDELYALILESFVVTTHRAQHSAARHGWPWPEVAGAMMHEVHNYFSSITPGTFLAEIEYSAGSSRTKLRDVRERAFRQRFGTSSSWVPNDEFWIEMSHATA